MNVERVLREIEKRLAHLPEEDRAEVLDAVQEELVRERRRLEPVATVEVERERRLEAETLREILEAINRQARLSETIDEVLKQLGKIVVFDSCALGLREPSGGFRILAVRGLEATDAVVGRVFDTPLTSAVMASRWPLTLSDVREDVRWSLGEESPIRSWAGMPLLVEGEVIGLLVISRHNVDPFQTTIRGLASYTIPKIDVLVSTTIRSQPGLQLTATWQVPNSVIQQALGHLPFGATPTGTTNITTLIDNSNKVFADRRTQLDMRFAKVLRFGRTRSDVGVDLFNLFNANYPTAYNTTYVYGTDNAPRPAGWATPTSIYTPRFVRLNYTIDF